MLSHYSIIFLQKLLYFDIIDIGREKGRVVDRKKIWIKRKSSKMKRKKWNFFRKKKILE